MKTQRYSTPETLACFAARIAGGDVVHGSPFSDLSELRLQTSGRLYVDATGDRVRRGPGGMGHR